MCENGNQNPSISLSFSIYEKSRGTESRNNSLVLQKLQSVIFPFEFLYPRNCQSLSTKTSSNLIWIVAMPFSTNYLRDFLMKNSNQSNTTNPSLIGKQLMGKPHITNQQLRLESIFGSENTNKYLVHLLNIITLKNKPCIIRNATNILVLNQQHDKNSLFSTTNIERNIRDTSLQTTDSFSKDEIFLFMQSCL